MHSHSIATKTPRFDRLNVRNHNLLSGFVANIERYREYRDARLNLIASENLPSDLVRLCGAALADAHYSMIYRKPADVDPNWAYQFLPCMADLLDIGTRLARELFHAAVADLRPLSGSLAELAILFGSTRPGDTIAHVGAGDGGHFACEPIAQRLGLRVIHLAFSRETLQLDVPRSVELVHREGAKLIMLDSSFILFPHPLAELRRAVGPDVRITYDCSHVMGLIAGGAFQMPLVEGADVLHGGTHKSFPGPQKGMILFAEPSPWSERLANTVFPVVQSNSHAGAILGVIAAMLEMQRWGREYAAQVVANARALADELAARGLIVAAKHLGYTASHQVWVQLPDSSRASNLALCDLPRAGFLTNNVRLPFQDDAYGLRLGTAELTRRGMREGEMRRVGRLLAEAITHRRALTAIANDVRRMAAGFRAPEYTLDLDPEAILDLILSKGPFHAKDPQVHTAVL